MKKLSHFSVCALLIFGPLASAAEATVGEFGLSRSVKITKKMHTKVHCAIEDSTIKNWECLGGVQIPRHIFPNQLGESFIYGSCSVPGGSVRPTDMTVSIAHRADGYCMDEGFGNEAERKYYCKNDNPSTIVATVGMQCAR